MPRGVALVRRSPRTQASVQVHKTSERHDPVHRAEDEDHATTCQQGKAPADTRYPRPKAYLPSEKPIVRAAADMSYRCAARCSVRSR